MDGWMDRCIHMITYTVGTQVGIFSGDSLPFPFPPLPVGGCGPVCEGYIDTR